MSDNDLETRTTAVGLYHYALSYQASAEMLHQSPPDDLMFDAPVRFLFFHAAELFLKAYLRAKGAALSELRKLGHSHRALHLECVRKGFPPRTYAEAFADFTDDSDPIESRYIVTGYKEQPSLEAMAKWCNELRATVRDELKSRNMPVR